MRNVYVACPWDLKEQAKAAAKRFKAAGWTIASHWFNYTGSGDIANPTQFREEALRDVEEVINSDLLVLLNLQKRGEETSGKAVETGLAIACGIPVIVVGGWTNVFHFLPDVTMVETVEEAIQEAEHVIREQCQNEREYYPTEA